MYTTPLHNMTTADGNGDDASAEDSMVIVVDSAQSECSDEELGSVEKPADESSQAPNDAKEPPTRSEHVCSSSATETDESTGALNVKKKPVDKVSKAKTGEEKEVHPDSTESNEKQSSYPISTDSQVKPDMEVVRKEAPNTPAASLYSPPLTRKRGRVLPTAWSRKNKLKDTSDSDYESYDDEAAEIFLSTSANLAYSWDTLGLGHDLGSAALNRYMARFNENSPQLTAQQTLQIVNSLRLQTIMPPEFSALHRIIQRNPLENQQFLYGSDDQDDLVPPTAELPAAEFDKNTMVRLPFKTLARLYETMCEQDVDDGSSNRREVQYLSAGACLERLKLFENTACALRRREEQVLERANELGLIDNTQVSAMLGYHLPST